MTNMLTPTTLGLSDQPSTETASGNRLGDVPSRNSCPTIATAMREPPAEASLLADFSRHLHSHVRDYIQFADQKAAFIFAFGGALLIYEFQKNLHFRWLKSASMWSTTDFASFISMLCLCACELLAVCVVFPRLQVSHSGGIFFRSISNHDSASAYVAKMTSLSSGDLSAEIFRHTYDLAQICSTKYSVVRYAVWAALAGSVTGIFALLS